MRQISLVLTLIWGLACTGLNRAEPVSEPEKKNSFQTGSKTTKTEADGLGFESRPEIGRWEAFGKASAAVTDEYAFRGKRSMKLRFDEEVCGVRFQTEVRAWSKFSRLRFTVSNPTPVVSKYRIFQIQDHKGDHYLPQGCDIPGSYLLVPPETTREVNLDLESIKDVIDLRDVRSLLFYRGSPETTFYIDNLKLMTQDEIVREETGTRQEQIRTLIADLKKSRGAGGEYSLQKADRLIGELEPLLQKPNFRGIEKDVDAALTHARTFLTVLNVLARHPDPQGQEIMVLLGASPCDKIFRDQEFDAVDFPYHLSAARNEWESFQVVVVPRRPLFHVKAGATPLVSAADPQHTISPEHIRINPVGYVEVPRSFYYTSSRPGWWPDPLVKNDPVDVIDRLQPFWISVYVPANQTPGVYRGEIVFQADDDEPQSIAYEVCVRNFTLPKRGELVTFFDFRSPPNNQETRRKVFDLLLSHRLNPTAIYGESGRWNGWWVPGRDDLQYCLDRGMNRFNLGFLYDPDNAADPFSFNEAYMRKMAAFLREIKPFLEEHHCWDMATVNGFDELMHQDRATVEKRLTEARKICRFLKKEFPDLALCNMGQKLEIETDLMDIWFVPPAPVEEMDDIRRAGKQVGFYWVYGDPSFMLDLPGIAPRICSWLAFKYQAAAIGYYSTYRLKDLKCSPQNAPEGVDWPNERCSVETFEGRRGRNGDGNLLYPGRDGSVLASVRLENLRDGIEDYEYLALLRKLLNGKDHKLLSVPDSIVTLQTYTRDPAVIEQHRLAVAEAIEKLLTDQ